MSQNQEVSNISNQLMDLVCQIILPQNPTKNLQGPSVMPTPPLRGFGSNPGKNRKRSFKEPFSKAKSMVVAQKRGTLKVLLVKGILNNRSHSGLPSILTSQSHAYHKSPKKKQETQLWSSLCFTLPPADLLWHHSLSHLTSDFSEGHIFLG